ncbi:flagellar assembly peptidoglycan hydrolase FlgJ [Burkholderia cenocepacia]|jgi:flagellar protein FlgJ|uniref:flagellar assembly peptidoglycan hydrolase FlgJ n=1 Tax=Burkholderia cenocepacia TaxID=95486 RepID=UPI0004F6E971|nr:flagellar assembly peptidoglycan hydrolase FlgJ [Burkholderia cenocepacia]AIO49473.1 flagellar rod assembly protein/muramidase FlgJ [Burkholderia cepacia]KGB94517.1 flagellar rod assembly protein/muramidase FlgJ [Burkholderia cepacia]MBN3503857.1 flagellar assembly peptidoglycan hydrolase FlgJ [Burkholderia cenocepacia]MBN3529552.1 flagellar assembly peptidoglycan hydrolase FlgJ [Burkholderia cenocepacia]MBO1852608.1 flagellar assembly peptidoglycan hydrolase FlgJ [Burkholderia cenocepacia]
MAANLPNANDLTQRFALDVQGFDALRAQAKQSPQAGAKAVAGQFDAMFTQMMLKSMRDASPDGGLFDSHTSKMYTSMLDQQLAQQMSTRGIGVADALMKQLLRNAGVGAGVGAGSDTAADVGAGGIGGLGTAGNEGSLAAMNAMAKAYANAANNGALAGARGYSAGSALTPPLKGASGVQDADAFVDRLAGPAQAASATTGIPARFIVGQAALESGWGKREIRAADGSTSYNVFGIKANKGWTGRTVSALTTEYVNGTPRRVVAKFRAYDSYEHAMTDYANLLKNNPRYAGVLSASRSVEGFAHGMQKAGYATDPNYAKKLISIMQQIG